MDSTPRTIRDKLIAQLGQKIVVSTSDNHYISGVVQLVESGTVTLTVGGQPVVVPTRSILSLHDAPAHLAEYVK